MFLIDCETADDGHIETLPFVFTTLTTAKGYLVKALPWVENFNWKDSADGKKVVLSENDNTSYTIYKVGVDPETK